MRWTLILAVGALAGCASLQGSDAPDPEQRFDRAMEALERQDFRSAYEQFSLVYTGHWNQPVSERALLAMAAVELDPRNGGRRLDIGADLAARHFQLAGSPSWTTPVSQTLYLLALELGAAEERAARAEAEKERAEVEKQEAQRQAEQAERQKQQAEKEKRAARAEVQRAKAQARAATAKARAVERETRPLPRYSGTSVSARVGELSAERARLRDQVQALRRQLAEREQELERIRATLAPRG
jgi:chemotaxis protein histidine kinase CheA